MRSGFCQHAHPAFSLCHYSSSNDPLSQPASRADERFAITATKPESPDSGTCPGFAPDSLVQQNKICVSEDVSLRVAQAPQKLCMKLLCFAAFHVRRKAYKKRRFVF